MPNSLPDPDLLPLSWLSQWGYCPRRCGLLAIEQLWSDNAFTVEGTLQHKRVHTARVEKRGDQMAFYERPVFSNALGLSGLCDCVEARRIAPSDHAAVSGATLPDSEGQWQLYPVEYKHGVVRHHEGEYHIQLCAQAICLEEMYGGHIPAGAIFYIKDHRRDEILLTDELRQRTVKAAKDIHDMLEDGIIPMAQKTAKCQKCSMVDSCMPDAQTTAAAYLSALKTSLSEDES